MLLPLEYPTVVLELATAAVWRIVDGLLGALVCSEGNSADVFGFNSCADAGLARMLEGFAPERAAAAWRDLMVEALLAGLVCGTL